MRLDSDQTVTLEGTRPFPWELVGVHAPANAANVDGDFFLLNVERSLT